MSASRSSTGAARGQPSRDREKLFQRPAEDVGRGHEEEDDGFDESAPLRSRAVGGTPAAAFSASSSSKAASNGTAAAGASGQVQVAIRAELAQQDAVLDALHSSVERLGHISEQIHEEIAVQDRMLDELDDSVQRTDASVNEATRRTRDLIRRNGGSQWCCALVLMATALVVLILYIVGWL